MAIGYPYPDHGYLYTDFDTYKLVAFVYLNDTVYDDGPVISFYEVINDFQYTGTNCRIGGYDGANCYVGSAPSGTTAFIYAGNFYYTPVNGNQCPLVGSGYDGATCFVATIPSYTYPFIWNNSWYVGPYVDSNLFGKVE